MGLAKRINAKVLQASTSEVYGDSIVHTQVEECWGNVNPIDIRSCYEEGKRCAETLFFGNYSLISIAQGRCVCFSQWRSFLVKARC